MIKRCIYCRKTGIYTKKEDKCKACEKEFKTVCDAILKRYGNIFKQMGNTL